MVVCFPPVVLVLLLDLGHVVLYRLPPGLAVAWTAFSSRSPFLAFLPYFRVIGSLLPIYMYGKLFPLPVRDAIVEV